MAASVTVHHKAFGDPRIAYLGQLAGYDVDAALGKMTRLWSLCTERQTDCPDAREIRSCLGPNGDQYLVESGLGELLEGGRIRVRGCEGRTEWYGDMPAVRSAGGRKRASTARRDAGGRMLPAGSAGPPAASSSQQPASSQPAEPSRSELALDPELPEEEKTPAPRAHAIPPTTEPVVPSTEHESGGDPELPEQGPLPEIRRSPEVSLEPELRATAEFFTRKRAFASQVLGKLGEIRQRRAKELGVEARPLPAFPPGERDLMARLGEPLTLEDGLEAAMHVLAIADAEAGAQGTVQWLTTALFSERSWRRALGMTVEDAKRSRASPSNGARDRRPEEPPRRIKTL